MTLDPSAPRAMLEPMSTKAEGVAINAAEARALIACVVFASEETVCPGDAWEAAERLAKDLDLPSLPCIKNGYGSAGFYSWREIP